MSGNAISKEALLAALQDIRLPNSAAGGTIAELAAIVAFGGLAALITTSVLRALSLQRRKLSTEPSEPWATQETAADPSARRLAALRQLKARAPERYARFADALYRPDGHPTLEQIEAELARLD